MKVLLQNTAKLLLYNFLLIYTIGRIFIFIGIDLHYIQIFHLILGIYGIQFLIQKGVKSYDYLVLTYMLYLLLNGIFIDYDNHWSYFYRTLPTTIAGIFFYFIGRYSNIQTINILKRMKWPWIVLSIIGLYCFIMLPTWYVQMKTSQVQYEEVDVYVRNIYRLSSIWGHPYQITYATFLFSVFLISSLTNNREKRKTLLLLLLCVIILLLGQIRAAIWGFLLNLFVFFILYKKIKWHKMILNCVLVFCVIYSVSTLILIVDNDQYQYMIEHMLNITEDGALADRLEQTSGGITDYTLFGNGYGRYGFEAREHNLFAIVDSEYQKHLAEVGFLGFFILSTLLMVTFLKVLKEKNFSIDFCVFLFYCFAMLGASALSNASQYSFMFWFCMGSIWKSKSSYLSNEV